MYVLLFLVTTQATQVDRVTRLVAGVGWEEDMYCHCYYRADWRTQVVDLEVDGVS